MYGYGQAWHFERELTGHDARLAMATSPTPSVLGPKYTLHKEVYKPKVRIGIRAIRVARRIDFLAVVARRRTGLANVITWANNCVEG